MATNNKKPKPQEENNVNNLLLEDMYRSRKSGAKNTGIASISDADLQNWQQWRSQNMARLDAEYAQRDFDRSIRSLDQNVVSRVADQYKSQWGSKYYYDMFDPEDYQRMVRGQMPKYLDKTYDLNDPYDQWLYQNNLPSKDTFSDMYSQGVLDYEEEQTERYNRLKGIEGDWNEYADSYNAFQADVVNLTKAVQKLKGRELTEKELGDIIESALMSGKYDALVPYYNAGSTEDTDKTDFELYAEGLNTADFSAYDKMFEAMQNGTAVDDSFFEDFKESDYKKWFAGKAAFGQQNLNDAYAAAIAQEQVQKAAEYAKAVETGDAAKAGEAIDAMAADIDEQMSDPKWDKANKALKRLGFLNDWASAVMGGSTPTISDEEIEKLLARKGYSDEDIEEYISLRNQRRLLAEEKINIPQYAQQAEVDKKKIKCEEMTTAAKSDPEFEKYASEGQGYVYGGDDSDFIAALKNATGHHYDYLIDPEDYAMQYRDSEEIAVYKYYKNKYGEEKAQEYVDNLMPTLYERSAEADEKLAQNAYKMSPWLASYAQTVMQPITAIEGYTTLVQGAVDVLGGESGLVQLNDPRLRQTRATTAARELTSEGMTPTGQFFYQTTMSMLDNAARLPMGYAGLAVVGGSTFAQGTERALAKGATPEQALALGAVSASIEVLTEKIGLDNLISKKMAGSVKEFAIKQLKQAGVEADEEMIAEILNVIADAAILQNNSDWAKDVAEYMADGMTIELAQQRVLADRCIDVMLAGAGGFISGVIMGGGSMLIENYSVGLKNGGNALNALSVGTKAIAQYNEDVQTQAKLGADTFAEAAKDTIALPLEKQEKRDTIRAIGRLAQQPVGWLPQDVATGYHKSIASIKALANKIRTLSADFSAKQAKISARLTKMLDGIATAHEEAAAALERGDLNAHHAAVQKAQKAMSDYRAEYSAAEAETAALKAKQAEQESAIAAKAKAEAENLKALVAKGATWQEKLAAIRDQLEDEEWDAMSLEEREAIIAQGEVDLGITQDDIAANVADAFMRDDQEAFAFWESMLDHGNAQENAPLSPSKNDDNIVMESIVNGGATNETVQAKGETNAETGSTDVSTDRAERVLSRDQQRDGRIDNRSRGTGRAQKSQSQTRKENGDDGRGVRGNISDLTWGKQQDDDLRGAIDDFNRKHRTSLPADTLREAKNIPAVLKAAAQRAKDITGRDVFFIESAENNFAGGFVTPDKKRRYVVVTGDNVKDIFNLFHEHGHSTPVLLHAIRSLIEDGGALANAYTSYTAKRKANLTEKYGAEYANKEPETDIAEEFSCDMFGAVMLEDLTGKRRWDWLGISKDDVGLVRNAIEDAFPSGSLSETDAETADDYHVLLDSGSAIGENDSYAFSLTSMRHDRDDYRDDLIEAGIAGPGKPMSLRELDTLFNVIDRVMSVVDKHSTILDYAIGVTAEDRAYSPYKTNADPHYKVALDFSTLCRKRILLQTISERLQVKLQRNLTAEEQIAIRNELKRLQDEGKRIEVACALCYVEAARLKTPKVVNTFLDNRAKKMTDYFAKKNSDFMRSVRTQQEAFKVSRGYDAKATKKQMTSKDRAEFNRLTPQWRAAYQPSEQELAIIKKAEEMDRARFLSADSLTRMATEDPEIYDAFVSTVRSATRSKAQETRVPYYRGDIGSVSDALIEEMNEESGFRHQSWSDFETIHLLDDIAAVIEMATRRAKMHTYTKVPNMVRVNGLTNMLINMSLIPAGDTGLNADGSLAFDPVEGMPYETMKELRELYSDVAGSIAIGINDQQILKLLDSEFIDYVIPYHISGLNKTLRGKMGIKVWADYTNTQNEKPNGKGEEGAAPALREWFNASEGAKAADGSAYMVEASKRYLELCHERNLVPKFPQFLQKNADGSYSLRDDAQNYWKLLIDRKMVDQSTNKVIEQKAVLPIFDDAVLQDILQQEIDNPSHADDEEVADYIVDKVERGELAISKAAKQEYKELREKQALDAIKAASGEFQFSENGPVPVTKADIDAIQTIGRKSVNEFTSEDIEKAGAFERRYFQELGVKSPFFRAWFGDWRCFDKTILGQVDIDSSKTIKAGKAKNTDTGRMISWNPEVSKESVLNAPKDSKNDILIVAANIEEIVKNAILLDTFGSEKDSKRKMPGTAFMHSFYFVAWVNKKLSLYKLYAEEALSPRDEVFTRAYSLKTITKIADIDDGVHSEKGGLTGSLSAPIKRVADLFALVKQYDSSFNPKSVDPSKLNDDGTPKAKYRQTGAGTYDIDPDFRFSENAPTKRQSRLNDAWNLYDDGSNPIEYYDSNPREFDIKTSNLLRGLMLRNGENVGGTLADNVMERVLDIFGHANKRHAIGLTFSSPVRIFEDATGWGGKTAEERANNVKDGNFLKNTYYEYGNVQAANRELWIADKMRPIIEATTKNGAYGAFESAVTQMLGEGIITEEQAKNAVSDGKTMIIQTEDGVFVLDKKAQLVYSSDSHTATKYDEAFRERLKRFAQRKSVSELMPKPTQLNGVLKVERTKDSVIVKDHEGNVVAEVRQGNAPNMKSVTAAVTALKQFYKDAYKEISDARLENGYAPPGYIENYFPHQSRTYNGVEGFIEALTANDLPTAINGMTGQFSPGQPWNANLQSRLGTYTEFDAIRGFNRYVHGAGDTIFYTPVIQRLRQLEKALRTQGANALSAEDQTRNSAFVDWLHEWANEWANKKSSFDRGAESVFGREAYSVSKMLTSMVSQASVGGSVSSALSNIVSGLTGYAQLDGKHVTTEVFRTIGQMLQLLNKNGSYDGFADKIPFMQRRFSKNEDILLNDLDKFKRGSSKALYILFSAVDRFMVESVARAKYAECIADGMSQTQAIAATNDMLIKNFSDRGKGQAARAFNVKWLKPVTQFQVEVLNQMFHFRDMDRAEVEAKLYALEREYGEGIPFDELSKQALSSGGIRKLKKEVMYLVLLSLWGMVTRGLLGRDQTWNPLGMATDAVEDLREGGLKQAGEGIMESVIDNTPFLSTLSGGGRVPIAGNISNVTNIIESLLNGDSLTDADWVKAGTSFIPGGGQIRKTYQGIKANVEGGKYTDDGRLQYPVTEEDFWKTVVFGPSAAAPDDYEWTDALSDKETAVYKELVAEGYDQADLYDTLLNYGGSTNAEKALSLLANRNGFDDDELDVIAEAVGLSYRGSLEGYAEREADKYLSKKEKELENGEISQEKFDEIETVFDEYFRLLGMN